MRCGVFKLVNMVTQHLPSFVNNPTVVGIEPRNETLVDIQDAQRVSPQGFAPPLTLRNSSDDIFPINSGSVPSKFEFVRSKCLRLVRFRNDEGSAPIPDVIFTKLRVSSQFKLPHPSGILPPKPVPPNMRVIRFDIPAKAGSGPIIEFISNESVCNAVARSRLVGMYPVSAFPPSRSRSVTSKGTKQSKC